MEEVWKDIKGYEGLYEVSNLGRVRRCDAEIERKNRWNGKTNLVWKGHIVKTHTSRRSGYTSVGLCKDGVHSVIRLHRVVAQAFLDNPDNLPQINHKDGNKTNNAVSNLEWCTASYNQLHAYKTGLNHGWKSKPVEQYTKDGVFIKSWPDAITAEKTLGIHNITACCRGVRNSAGGYSWRRPDGR